MTLYGGEEGGSLAVGWQRIKEGAYCRCALLRGEGCKGRVGHDAAEVRPKPTGILTLCKMGPKSCIDEAAKTVHVGTIRIASAP